MIDYNSAKKAWQAKLLGPWPGDEALTLAHYFGRPGKQSLALAMAMRDCGVTAPQIIIACGAPQNNHRTAVVTAGYFKRDMGAGFNNLGHTVYKVTLTPKGQAFIDRRKAGAAVAANQAAQTPPAKAGKAKAANAARKRAVPQAPTAPTVPNDAPTAPTVPQADAPQAPVG